MKLNSIITQKKYPKPQRIIMPTSINYQIPRPGGTETYIRNLIRNTIEFEIKVFLLCIGKEKREDYNGKLQIIPVTRKAKNELIFTLKMLIKKGLGFFRFSNNTIIVANGEHYCLPFLIFGKKHKIILIAHGATLPTLKIKKSGQYIWLYEHLVEKLVINKVDKIIAVNKDAKKYYQEKYELQPNKIIEIPIGVDISLFKPLNRVEIREKYGFRSDDRIIIYIGRFAKEKRIDILLKSFKDIEKQINSKLFLIGSGPEQKNLKSLAFKLKLKNVIFHEPVKNEEIPKIINCADVLVLCSDFEEMPTIILEALACGVPVVSSNVGDVNKVVNDKTGYLLEDVNYITIKDAILDVIGNGRHYYQNNCILVAKRYSWKSISQKIMDVYVDVLMDKKLK